MWGGKWKVRIFLLRSFCVEFTPSQLILGDTDVTSFWCREDIFLYYYYFLNFIEM